MDLIYYRLGQEPIVSTGHFISLHSVSYRITNTGKLLVSCVMSSSESSASVGVDRILPVFIVVGKERISEVSEQVIHRLAHELLEHHKITINRNQTFGETKNDEDIEEPQGLIIEYVQLETPL